MDNELYTGVDLVRSKEWTYIKQLIASYASKLLQKAVNLGAEEEFDRQRIVFISTHKYFEDFINQVETAAQKEQLDHQNKDSLNRETVPNF